MSQEDGTVDIHTEKLGCNVQFTYTNHRGNTHTYLVDVTKDSFVYEPNEYIYPDEPERKVWCIRANVLQRDGELRDGGIAERSFVLSKIRDWTEVPS